MYKVLQLTKASVPLSRKHLSQLTLEVYGGDRGRDEKVVEWNIES